MPYQNETLVDNDAMQILSDTLVDKVEEMQIPMQMLPEITSRILIAIADSMLQPAEIDGTTLMRVGSHAGDGTSIEVHVTKFETIPETTTSN